MRAFAQRVVDSDAFASAVPMLILGNAAAMAMEAIPHYDHGYHEALEVFFLVSQVLFVVEIGLRIAAAEGLRAFAADGWNRFDTAIVVVSMVPVVGPLAPLGRLFRILRVLRLFSSFEAMRDVVEADHVTGPALGPLAVLLGTVWGVSALAGHTLFAELDPSRWGDLFLALRTTFYLGVFTDVRPAVDPLTEAVPASLLFFATFYLALIGAFLQVLTATLAPRRAE